MKDGVGYSIIQRPLKELVSGKHTTRAKLPAATTATPVGHKNFVFVPIPFTKPETPAVPAIVVTVAVARSMRLIRWFWLSDCNTEEERNFHTEDPNL